MITARLEGRSRVVANIQQRINAYGNKVADATQGAGIDCQAEMKRGCPVKTGRLRSSVQYRKIARLSCKIGTNVKYAKAVNFGHRTRNGRTVAPNPFFTVAVIHTKQSFIKELKTIKI